MSLSVLMQELAALGPKDRRRVLAYLVTLQSQDDDVYRERLAASIDKPVAEFATLEDLDQRLGLTGDSRQR